MTLLTLIRAEEARPSRHRRTEEARPSRHRSAAPGTPRSIYWARSALALICVGQLALAVLPRRNDSPFEDEGLYIYIGHRMLEHIFHDAHLSEYPGAYFSGAPGFYPVLAALGDSIAGLNGARGVSLLFAIGATICVNGLGRQLYGVRAGLLGATAFVLCGSVIFQSWFATFDSTTLFFVAAASWVTVHSVERNSYLWAPGVALLMTCAIIAKYGGVIYLPIVALLAVGLAARRGKDVIVVARRATYMVAATAVVLYALFTLWGESLRVGIISTTLSRAPINPASPPELVEQVGQWVGPWLLLAVVGAILSRRSWPVALVLLLGSVTAPLQQIRIGEATSLAKHVAFGIIFAAPLIGFLMATLTRRLRLITIPFVACLLVALGGFGLQDSGRLLNGWVPNDALVPVLQSVIEASPGKTILGDQPSPERYLLRQETAPLQWTDTYSFSYNHKTGMPAYREAIQQSHFGVIYLAVRSNTPNGRKLYDYLQTTDTPYKQVAIVNRTMYAEPAGVWIIYMPEVTPTPDLESGSG
jgi:4-amino-4-deoxy-L-arabinose transferase-like glycosyltransferase